MGFRVFILIFGLIIGGFAQAGGGGGGFSSWLVLKDLFNKANFQEGKLLSSTNCTSTNEWNSTNGRRTIVVESTGEECRPSWDPGLLIITRISVQDLETLFVSVGLKCSGKPNHKYCKSPETTPYSERV